MINHEHFDRIVKAMPILQRADRKMAEEFRQSAFYASIPVGKSVFVEGDRIDAITLLISGVVRVYKVGETGREITLYRFGAGQSCILSANAILSQESFPAIAVVEQYAEAVMVPADAFREWVRRYDMWYSFVLELLSQRLVNLMAVVEEVAFRRMDARVAGLLLARRVTEGPISITHQEIASELGSSREVISRILEGFASEGLIRSARNVVEVVNFEGLQARSAV